MKTVVHVNDKVQVAGGVEVYLAQLHPLLRERGWQSHWIGVTRHGQELEIESAEPTGRWHGKLSAFRDAPIIQRLLRSSGVTHVHSLSDPQIMRELFSFAPVVRTMHEPRVFCPGQGKFWQRSESVCDRPFGMHCVMHAYTQMCCNRHPKRLLAAINNVRFEIDYAASRYAAMIANSQYIADEAMRAGIRCRRLEVLPYFTPTAEAGESNHPARIVFAGRLSRTKGVHYLIDAVSIVKESVPNVHVDILGDGIHRKEFERQVDQLALKNQIQFHGWADREKIDEMVGLATVVAFPSIYPEAFGISGIEAMMRGKPVVGFDVGGVRDWLQHEFTGLLVTPNDTQEFATSLVRLLQDGQLRRRLGVSARETAMQKFSSKSHLDRLLQIYEQCLIA